MPRSAPRSPFVIDHVAQQSIVAVGGGWSWKFDPRVFTHDGVSPEGHIEHTLKAVERLHQQAGRAPSADQVPQKVR